MSSEIRAILADMRSSRRAVFEDLQGIPESRMVYETQWAGGPTDVRFIFLRLTDHEEGHTLQVRGMLEDAGFRQTTAQRILAAAEVTRGDLLATLIGLTDGDLDVAPDGEWPLRRTLAHIINVEHSYRVNIAHSAQLAREGKAYEHAPEHLMPPPLEASLDGSMADFVERLDAAREVAVDELSTLGDDALRAPSRWASRDVDVRFRLMRFAHHEREHTAHILKWRHQTGRVPTEAQHLLGLAWRARGVLAAQLLGAPDDLLTVAPSNGDWPLRRILEHITSTETFLRDRILNASAPIS